MRMLTMSPSNSQDSTEIARILTILQGKWTVPVLCEMRKGPVRLGQLKHRSHKHLKRA